MIRQRDSGEKLPGVKLLTQILEHDRVEVRRSKERMRQRNRGARCTMGNPLYSVTMGRPLPALTISFIKMEGFKPTLTHREGVFHSIIYFRGVYDRGQKYQFCLN